MSWTCQNVFQYQRKGSVSVLSRCKNVPKTPIPMHGPLLSSMFGSAKSKSSDVQICLILRESLWLPKLPELRGSFVHVIANARSDCKLSTVQTTFFVLSHLQWHFPKLKSKLKARARTSLFTETSKQRSQSSHVFFTMFWALWSSGSFDLLKSHRIKTAVICWCISLRNTLPTAWFTALNRTYIGNQLLGSKKKPILFQAER